MRAPWITGREALRARLANPAQVAAPTPEAEMPPYMEAFLAHLRLLVGVPFDYLVPDARLLPDESIRFFYLDRSWTDRLVDGAVAVGKIGTREQAHHQAHHPNLCRALDWTERGVRDLQRGRRTFQAVRDRPDRGVADTITGFLLRSAAVSGWPHMDVRAFDVVLDPNFDPNVAARHQLRTLRLERLSPAVLLALFEGIPKLVWCEEPHHGVQFGVHENSGQFSVLRRSQSGRALAGQDVPVPVRRANRRVLGIAALRRQLQQLRQAQAPSGDPQKDLPNQTGSAALAVELLNLPWRQRFQGAGGRPTIHGTGGFVPHFVVAPNITQPDLQALIKGFVK
jgi:hypothetical protein